MVFAGCRVIFMGFLQPALRNTERMRGWQVKYFLHVGGKSPRLVRLNSLALRVSESPRSK